MGTAHQAQPCDSVMSHEKCLALLLTREVRAHACEVFSELQKECLQGADDTADLSTRLSLKHVYVSK